MLICTPNICAAQNTPVMTEQVYRAQGISTHHRHSWLWRGSGAGNGLVSHQGWGQRVWVLNLCCTLESPVELSKIWMSGSHLWGFWVHCLGWDLGLGRFYTAKCWEASLLHGPGPLNPLRSWAAHIDLHIRVALRSRSLGRLTHLLKATQLGH